MAMEKYRARRLGALRVALVVLVPLLLCALMALSEARRQVAGQAQLVAHVLREQGESMAHHEWNLDDRLDLSNLINAMATLYACDVDMHFSSGVSIRNNTRPNASMHALDFAVEQHARDGSVWVRVSMPGDRALAVWWSSIPTVLPAALILMALMGYAFWRFDRQTPVHMLHRGMRHGEFHLNYQPIYDMGKQRCVGVEVLMRWLRDGREEVPPDVFIEQAEANGLIIPLTLHLFQLIEFDMRSWPVRPGFRLAVNIAAEHLSSPDLVAHMRTFRERIARHEIDLTVEITERSLVTDDRQACANIAALRADGVRVAIDDFGVGHCSLAYLQRFAIDSLKVDKGFMGAVESPDSDAPILDAIINLARRLGLPVLVEGVETQAQFAFLAARQVDFVQGFLYARPMPSSQLLTWLDGQENSNLLGQLALFEAAPPVGA